MLVEFNLVLPLVVSINKTVHAPITERLVYLRTERYVIDRPPLVQEMKSHVVTKMDEEISAGVVSGHSVCVEVTWDGDLSINVALPGPLTKGMTDHFGTENS